jgi:transcriptional regulator with GAF, ATPase, and Fis domain
MTSRSTSEAKASRPPSTREATVDQNSAPVPKKAAAPTKAPGMKPSGLHAPWMQIPNAATATKAPRTTAELEVCHRRDEVVRSLTEPDTTVAQAAEKLGIGRATIYREIAQYGIQVNTRAGGPA